MKNKKEIINNSDYIVLNPKEKIGKWSSVFQNNHPIYLEIGMGKGDFIRQNALMHPENNYIGIEKFDSIMALAIKKIDEDIPNLKLIRMDALEINQVFDHEINTLYLNFSDPWPKPRHAKRRLTSPTFLEKYEQIFKDCRIIEMKTDNRSLFEYSLISFTQNGYKINNISLDLHNSDFENNVMTEYEKKFSDLNNVIYYVKVVK